MSAPTITMNNANNSFGGTKLVLTGGANGVTIADGASTLVLGNGTATTGNTTITENAATGNIQIGAASSDTLSFGGNLTMSTNAGTSGTITTTANNLTVTGNTSLTTAGAGLGAITLGGTPTSTTNFNLVGTVTANSNANSGAVTIGDNSALVLGAITTGGGNLVAKSLIGITNPAAVVSVGGTTALTSGTGLAPGSIQIGTTAKPAALAGTITLGTAVNVTLVNSDLTDVTSGTTSGSTSITQTGNSGANEVDLTGTFPALSIIDTGNYATLTGPVNVTNTGNIALSNQTLAGTGAVAISSSGSITLGSGIGTASGPTTFTSTGAHAGISDTAGSPIWIGGSTTFVSDGSINVNNNTSNSFGQAIRN